jgi:ribulose kinase
MALTTGMAIAAGVSAASSLAGGAMAKSAAKKASKAQVQAAQDANAAQERMFQKQMELQEPFRQGGLTAQDQIMQLLGIGGDKTAARLRQYGESLWH